MSRPKLTATHAALALAALSLGLTVCLVLELRSQRVTLERDVEQGVSAGIQQGVGAALAPSEVRETSAAAARGVVDGLVGGTVETLVGSPGEGGQRAPLPESVAVGATELGDAGLELLQAALESKASPQPEESADASRARRAGRLAGQAVDVGLDVFGALLGPAPSERDREPEPTPEEETGDSAAQR